MIDPESPARIFANKDPNLYIRWEQNLKLLKISSLINKKTSKFFEKIYQTSNNSLWVPKTTLAWKDLKYTDLNIVFKKTGIKLNNKPLYLGVEKDNFLFDKKKELKNIIFIGSFIRRKNIEDFLRLAQIFPNLNFHVIGNKKYINIKTWTYVRKNFR